MGVSFKIKLAFLFCAQAKNHHLMPLSLSGRVPCDACSARVEVFLFESMFVELFTGGVFYLV